MAESQFIPTTLGHLARFSPPLATCYHRRCPGCLEKFELFLMQVDHIIPKSQFGSDLSFNLQLLCMSCNLLKGDGTMMELWGKLAEQKRQDRDLSVAPSVQSVLMT